MITIEVFAAAGDFAENKDIARQLRVGNLMPALDRRQPVTIDFTNVSLSTQSFVHALISDAFRKYGTGVLEEMSFKGCNPKIRALISTVCDYMQDGAESRQDAVTTKRRNKAKVAKPRQARVLARRVRGRK